MSIPQASPDRTPFPEPLLRFLDLFHRGEFWESHEVLEVPWRQSRSRFYQGLILYASAFVHAQRENPKGIVAQLGKAERALEPYAPAYLGVDVGRVLAAACDLRSRVEAAAASPPASWNAWVRYPTIDLDATRLRGDEPELV